MPKELEAALEKAAKKHGFKGKKKDKYVYGGLNNMGYKTGGKKKKGKKTKGRKTDMSGKAQDV